MPRILILSYHFYPSPAVGAKRVSELACRLRDAGWEVKVFTAPSETVRELAERISGIDVRTVRQPPKLYPLIARAFKSFQLIAGKVKAGNSRVTKESKALAPAHRADKPRDESWTAWLKRNYHAIELLVDDRKLWSLLVLQRALLTFRRYDWIFSSGPPASTHLAARVLAGMTGSRWIMDLRDPWVCNHFWPDQFQSASVLRDKIERYLERNCVQRADYVTVASPGIGNALYARVPGIRNKLQVVLNGYDGKPASKAIPSGKLRLMYAGSLYLNRNPFVLLEALKELVKSPTVDRSRIRFIMVGRCGSWNGKDVAEWVEAAGMGDVVQVLPPVPPRQVNAMMEEAEVLINFAQGQPEQIPAKLYDYIASGREMLLIAEGDSDAALVTLESGAGRVVEPNDAQGLRRVLAELYAFYVESRRAYEMSDEVVERFSRDYQNRRFMDLLAPSSV